MTAGRMVRENCVPQPSCEESAVGENDLVRGVCNEEVGRVDSSRNSGKDEVEESFSRHM